MLTPFALNSALAGGLLVLAMPQAYRSLLSLRYPHTYALTSAPVNIGHQPLLENPVIGPERLEGLRAARDERRRAFLPDVHRTA